MLVPAWINDGSDIPDPLGCGEAAVQWLRRLRHPKNPARGHPFQLDPWQERIIRRLYGPRNPDGTRIVRRVVLLLPRGNRKTSLCAAITLLHLFGPAALSGGLTVSAASAHEQAKELFKEAALIIDNDPRLNRELKIRDTYSSIVYDKLRSTYLAVAADGKALHGKTPNVVIADELHAWDGVSGRRQWEALDSALVKVPNTLLIVATTAGRGQENLAWQTVEYAIKVQRGEIEDPSTLPVIFAAEKDDDWQSEDLWFAVNPGMQHGYPDLASYRDKAKKAIVSPSDRESFQQYNLNVWLDHSASPFVDMLVYDRGKSEVDIDDLEAKQTPCWLGVDLSSNSDLTVVVAAWRDGEDGFQVWPWFFCPEDNLRRRADRDDVPYPMWAEDGLIVPTPGNVVDFRAVEDQIRELCARFNVREIAFDPHLARNSLNNLLDDGLPAVEMRQGWVTMAPAVKELERAIIGGRFRHGGHPILRWHFDNVAVETDKAGNRMFHKGRSRDRIDGAVACAMAIARAAAGNTGISSYDTFEGDLDDWSSV